MKRRASNYLIMIFIKNCTMNDLCTDISPISRELFTNLQDFVRILE
jgi:hypothetical protein